MPDALTATDLRQHSPHAQYQIVTATFNNAHEDLIIEHQLQPPTPEHVDYVVLRQGGSAAVIYHDTSGDRVPWTAGAIRLRSNIAGAQVRLLLTVAYDSWEIAEQANPNGPNPSLDAADIEGVLDPSNIPDLSATKITSDEFDAARIPNLDAAKITTGEIAKARQHAQTAYKDEANVFTANQRINANVGIQEAPSGSANIPLVVGDGLASKYLQIKGYNGNYSNIGLDSENALSLYSLTSGGSPIPVYLGNGQLRFPATQVASTNANTLDDYEEGTWTPVLGGLTSESGQSYASQNAFYQKIGDTVTIWCYVALAAKGTITGALVLKGLPFTVKASPSQYAPLVCGYWNSMATSWVFISGYAHHNATFAYIQGASAAVANTVGLTSSDVGNSSGMMFRMTYRVEN